MALTTPVPPTPADLPPPPSPGINSTSVNTKKERETEKKSDISGNYPVSHMSQHRADTSDDGQADSGRRLCRTKFITDLRHAGGLPFLWPQLVEHEIGGA